MSQNIYTDQNIIQVQPRTCFKCKYEADIAQSKCPSCGGNMKTRTQIRVLGFIMTLLSGFLVVFMSVTAFYMYNLIQQSGKPDISAKFTGDQNDILMIIAVFGLVILFGVVGLIAGLWQMILGKRNLVLVYTVLGIGAVLYICGFIFKFYIGK